ncbi:MAG: hypothetical protein II799_03790 [Lachnospiraceae bacterium]|nr:hypothetical protein [Lachnospiraceae bacterium]MBR0148765.1 hypothetical protein [Lachnospiraceae bacterium]
MGTDDKMLDDVVAMLDSQMKNGTGHVNLDYSEKAESPKSVETMGCADCSRTPLACSIPTLHQGLDDYR